jgi:hypothetical protein
LNAALVPATAGDFLVRKLEMIDLDPVKGRARGLRNRLLGFCPGAPCPNAVSAQIARPRLNSAPIADAIEGLLSSSTALRVLALVLASCAATARAQTPINFYGAATFAANAYTVSSLTPSSGFSLTAGYTVLFSTPSAGGNTAAATLNAAASGAEPLVKQIAGQTTFAPLAGGEIGANQTYAATVETANCPAAGTCYLVTNSPLSAVLGLATANTNTNVTQPQWANGTMFDISAASNTLSLPAVSGSTPLAQNGGILVQAIGNSWTLQPASADGINSTTNGTTGVGVSQTYPQGLYVISTPTGVSGAGAITVAGGSGGVANVRAVMSTSDTILTTDNGGVVTYNNASGVSVTLPQGGTAGFPDNAFVVSVANYGAGAVTITPTTSTISYGAAVGGTALPLAQGESAIIALGSDGNYRALVMAALSPTAAAGSCTNCNISYNAYGQITSAANGSTAVGNSTGTVIPCLQSTPQQTYFAASCNAIVASGGM